MATDLGRSTLSGTASSLNAIGVTSEVLGYETISVQITGTWSGTLSFQASNDNVNFENVFAQPVGTPNDGKPIVSTSMNGIYHIPVNFRYFQIKMTAYTSGTATLTGELYQESIGEPIGPQFANLQDTNGTSVTVGQKTMAASLPVVLASDQLFSSSGPTTVSSAIDVISSTDVSLFGNLSLELEISATATVTFYASNNNVNFYPVSLGYVVGSGTPTQVASQSGIYYRPIDFRYFKATVTTYVNGTVTGNLILRASGEGTDPAVRSTARVWNLVYTNDSVTSVPIDGAKATYSASISDLVVAATPTDIFTLTGSASKIVKVTRISISGNQNTSASRDVLLIKRSTANSGGTSTNQAAVPHDSNDVGATASAKAYTANPTSLGATVGTIRAKKIQLLATNVTNPLDNILWDFGNRPSRALVLRGVGESVAINLNGITSSSSSFDIDIEWTEE